MTETAPDDSTAAADPLLRISDITIEYRTGRRRWTPAVRGVSLHVEPGEFVSLVGESGSGKTTLVQGALGLLPAAARIRAGTIAYSGVDVTGWNDRRLALVRGNYVGFIPQDPNTALNPVKKIGQQVIEAVRFNQPRSNKAAQYREAALSSLRTAGLTDPERVFQQYPHELSGGMKQRALIAIALAGQPKIIIADEPTSALDVTVQKVILDHLIRLQDDLGIGILLVTHDLGVALDRSDRLLVMRDGEVVEQGPVRQVLTQPANDYTRRLLDAAPARHHGRLEPATGVRTVAADAPVALRAHALTKTYQLRGRRPHRELRALDAADLLVRAGTTHAIVGESGAGKSTLASILVGFTTADHGTVQVGDRELTSLRHTQLRELRRDLQFVFQNPFTSLDPRFPVSRIIAEPLHAFRLLPGKQQRRARVVELLRSVALDESYLDRLPSQLSGGQRQRVAIARALALNPRILVLDEAVSALDVSVQAQILQLLVDLQAELGLSYVFVTHDLGVVRLIADDVTVMQDGVVVETGEVEQVFHAPQHAYTRQLLAAMPGTRLAADAR
ncbi:dipeptide ABC transporter ATP-binding protein [Micromonospora endophytica]|uniref:ABC transporter ATP-binding protein n=1 Tax=Micromonospora endophytica TaxID=515350 RepID=A0A2W2E7Y8_9ACTN|nr:ABC transporter ATP-binding protein [Micromonospora endophytica]PZG01034.1 ABC transporter ATP-binding protein [Micromonospora endophytica]RIW47924.1 ABC transporter ATP-binding protein [Micromonospora endophytica]BCJ62297.1 ABC transporter ATP-binding protein [Micromonospora endophytica]